MRKVIMLILVLLIVLFTATIVVDERQNAVITNYNGKQRIEKSGIHFAWPIWDKVTYVFINERASLLTLAVNESEVGSNQSAEDQGNNKLRHPVVVGALKQDHAPEVSKSLSIEVLISYHVTNPVEYLAAVRRLDKTGISEEIAKILITDLTNKIKTSTLSKINQEGMFSADPTKFGDMGVRVDQINLLSIKFLDELPLPVKAESSVMMSSKKDDVNLESAYYQASLIKSKTKLNVDVIYQSMQIKDPKFYEYFKTLKTFEQDAKTKSDVPPLSQIQN